METTICIKCGSKKKRPYHKCRSCGFTPEDEDSLVRSVYLSTGRFEDPDTAEEYVAQLESFSSDIKEGKAVEYVSAELDRLRKQKHLVEAAPMSAVWGAVFRFFLPGIIFLAILWGLLILLKKLKGSG